MSVAEKAPKNYKVARGRFGRFETGRVLAKWMVERSGRTIDAVLKSGMLVETDEKVDVEYILPPEPQKQPEGLEEILADLNRLRSANERLEAELQTHKGRGEELFRLSEIQKVALSDQTVEITRYRTLAEDREKALSEAIEKNTELEDLLAKATAPSDPKAKGPKQ